MAMVIVITAIHILIRKIDILSLNDLMISETLAEAVTMSSRFYIERDKQ
jgi:hypothetical protein